MTIEEVLNHFGSVGKLKQATRIDYGAVRRWKENGYIPIVTQLRIEAFTKGKLKANLDHLK